MTCPDNLITIAMSTEQRDRLVTAVELLDKTDPISQTLDGQEDDLRLLAGMLESAETGCLNGFTL